MFELLFQYDHTVEHSRSPKKLALLYQRVPSRFSPNPDRASTPKESNDFDVSQPCPVCRSLDLPRKGFPQTTTGHPISIEDFFPIPSLS